MAGFMDTLGRRPDYDNSSSYQKMMLREISKKLLDLEALNEQNHASVEELRRLQKNLLTKMESMEMNQMCIRDSGYPVHPRAAERRYGEPDDSGEIPQDEGQRDPAEPGPGADHQ